MSAQCEPLSLSHKEVLDLMFLLYCSINQRKFPENRRVKSLWNWYKLKHVRYIWGRANRSSDLSGAHVHLFPHVDKPWSHNNKGMPRQCYAFFHSPPAISCLTAPVTPWHRLCQAPSVPAVTEKDISLLLALLGSKPCQAQDMFPPQVSTGLSLQYSSLFLSDLLIWSLDFV